MTRPTREESQRLAALAAVVECAVKAPTTAELERGLNALRVRTRAPRVRSRRLLLAAAALFGVVVGLVVLPLVEKRLRGGNEPVAVQRIEGGRFLEGGYLSEVGHGGIKLYFSEGSRFLLTPGTRGRLRTVTAEGARFELAHGTGSFAITPSPERHWWVEAGPFLVAVRGTDFTVEWDPTTERFEVQLRQGRVAVSGPIVGEDLVLRPGQNLTVSVPRGETVISEGRPAAPSVDGGATGDTIIPPASALAVPSVTTPPSAAPTASAPTNERRFREALANGEWDRILAGVEREGVEASLRTLSSDDLFALADAARYRRRAELARAALLAQRSRFPSSPRSLDALFLLGRVEELGAGGRTTAIQRYDEYLRAAPSGTYAAEALGRKMILTKETRGPDEARRIAVEYLERFPRGSYAEAARTLSRLP